MIDIKTDKLKKNQLESEPEYTNTKACADSAGAISTQQTEELYGLNSPANLQIENPDLV
jgi:hypothetical protein